MGEASTSGPPKPARHEAAAKLIIQRIKLDLKYSKHGIKESNSDKKGSRQSQAASLRRSGLIVTRLEVVEVGGLRGLSVRQFNPVFKRKQTQGSPRMTAVTFQSLRNGKRKGGRDDDMVLVSVQNLKTYQIVPVPKALNIHLYIKAIYLWTALAINKFQM